MAAVHGVAELVKEKTRVFCCATSPTRTAYARGHRAGCGEVGEVVLNPTSATTAKPQSVRHQW